MSRDLTCPSCGAGIAIRSSLALYTVCPYCQAMLVLHGTDLENLGKIASLPPDMSPIQIGATGTFRQRQFIVLGRLKWGWQQGFWTEWFIDFGDGQESWLAEAQGDYMLTQRVTFQKTPHLDSAAIKPDTRIDVGEDRFRVTDIKNVTCQASEGELPFASPRGYQTTIADATSVNKFLSVDLGGKDSFKYYLGQYVTLTDLKMTGLKAFEGW